MKNKIDLNLALSADEMVIDRIDVSISIFKDLNLDYIVFGSCALQAYLDYFLRLPNDLDVVVKKKDISVIKTYCLEKKYNFIDENGKYKIVTTNFSIHLIPEVLRIMQKPQNLLFSTIDLGNYLNRTNTRTVRFINAKKTVDVNVLSLEWNIFLELCRQIYTSSLVQIYHIFLHLTVNPIIFTEILENQPIFRKIVLTRLNEYRIRMNRMTYCPSHDIILVQSRILDLINKIK